MGHEPSSVVPPQLLHGQPSHALHETAFHLAEVDGRIDGLAGVVKNIGAQQLVLAGQGIDDYLRNSGTV